MTYSFDEFSIHLEFLLKSSLIVPALEKKIDQEFYSFKIEQYVYTLLTSKAGG